LSLLFKFSKNIKEGNKYDALWKWN
jgi:hypothetical protein